MIRVAGNVVDDVVLGSIEYAVEELDMPLVMVLGHERCGAVTAAVKHIQSKDHINAFIAAIAPALTQVNEADGDMIDATVTANVRLSVEQINAAKPVLSELVKQKKLQVIGARYDLDDGLVKVIT